MTFGSLFAGIGGFDLGFERAGMRCLWQVEINEFCRRVLAKHWPSVRRHDDVRTFPPAGDWAVDVICGGFPCQDLSLAGKGAGLAGERSGLWWEFHRVLGILRPAWAVIENVPALRSRGLDQVLGSLSSLGFDAEWHCVPASAVGARHRRDRIWIVAHAARVQPRREEQRAERQRAGASGESKPMADAHGLGGDSGAEPAGRQTGADAHQRSSRNVGDADGAGLEIRQGEPGYPRFAAPVRTDWWVVEPAVGRVAHGVPERVDRLKGLGNAIVPQLAEWIGRRLMESA